MPGRKSYAGAATGTTLTGGINSTDLSFATAAANNWPTGTGAQPFVVVIDRGTGDEEKILVDSRSGTAFTVNAAGRGYDGTTGVAHLTGASVEHCLDADTLTEANAHVNDDSRDDHSQYHNTTRHAAVNHLIGTHLPVPPAPSDVSTAAATGSSTSAARADHVHKLASGAINNANMIATGLITATHIATDAVDTAEIAANAVTASEIAADAVGTSEIAADAVTSAEIATGAVGPTEIANDAIEDQHISDAAINDVDMIDDNTISDERVFSNDVRPMMVGVAAAKPSAAGDGMVPGQLYYETDTYTLVQWQSATTGWTPPWNTAWGVLHFSQHTTDQTAIGTGAVDLADMVSASITTVANRRIRVTFNGMFLGAAAQLASVTLYEDATQVQLRQETNVGAHYLQLDATVTKTMAAGSYVWKAVGSTNSSTMTMTASATYPAQFIVEDMGPDGVPA